MSRRLGWTLAVLFLVPLVGLGFWLSRPGVLGFPVQEARLTNGMVLRLISVQHGTHHVDPFTPPWKQWLTRIPASWSRRLKLNLPPNLSTGPTNPALSVWLTASKVTTAAGQRSFGVQVGNDQDDFAGSNGTMFPTGKTPDGTHYEGHRLGIFPRRSPELRLRIYDEPWGGGKVLHEFRIPNPALIPPGTVAPWVAQATPPTSSEGDLEARLESFTVATETDPRAPDPAERKTRLEFTLRQAGEPTTNWVAYHVDSVRDATGNLGDGNNWNHGWAKDRTFVEFSHWPLPVGEPWKVGVEFCQRSGFPPQEVWEVHNVPIQKPGETLPSLTHELHGKTLTVVRLGNPKWGGSDHGDTRQVSLELKVDGKPDDRRWHMTIVKALDSTGRDVTTHGWSGSDDKRDFTFNVSTNAVSMDFWIAYAPSRKIEFFAQPAVTSNPPR